MKNSELPGCTLTTAKFELSDPNSKPVRGKVFSHSRDAREEIDRQVAGLLEDGFIERSTSTWGSPCLLVAKSDGSKRLCIDSRKVNSLLKHHIFTNNTLAEIVERVAAEKPKFFSSLDLRSAYQQIVVDEESRKFTAFVTHRGSFQFKRMSFGMQSSPSIWCETMAKVLADDPLLQKYCIPYQDDLLLFSRTAEEHTELLKRLLEALRKANLRVHSEKCAFLKPQVKYLGQIFSEAGVTACPKKLVAMLEFPRPKNKRPVKGFLGMVSYYRTYQADLAKKISPLNNLLKKNKRFVWDTDCEKSFLEVKKGLENIPVLAYPDEEKGAGGFILQVDASDQAVAGIFLQRSRDGKSENLIACYGRALRPNEEKWQIGEREGLSLLIGILKFRHFIVGNPKLEIRSDNMSVRFLQHISRSTSPRFARWSCAMSDILSRAEWTHVPGPKNVVADALSRRSYDP